MKKVLIIGAGASGLATSLKLSNNEVTILEKNNMSGKKLLITGNGRCNYFNDKHSILNYHSSSDNLNNFIKESDFDNIKAFFDSIGIEPVIKDGYYYPKSKEAISFRNVLELEAKLRGVDIIYNTNVIDIKKDNEIFTVYTSNGIKYEADYVVVATGGCSYENTGSDGKCLEIIKKLGHKIIKPLPGLVQLESDGKIKNANGVRTKVELTLYEDNIKIKNEIGELQITDYGISGICVMQLSSIVSKGLDNGKNEVIGINFLPEVSDVFYWLTERSKKLDNRNISQLLEGIINYKLIKLILRKSKIEEDEYLTDLTEERIKKLCDNITNYQVNINKTKGFSSAQITVGGISLQDVTSNFESKIINNLFFTGEILDVNGDCGGYNLMFAWLSALRVGEYINDKTKTN